MTVKRIIQESLDANPLGLKEAFVAAIQERIAEALENKIAEFAISEGFMVQEEVELDEGNAENKLKKNVYTAKLGNAADVTRSNFNSKELKPFTSRNSSGDSRPALKNAVGKMLRAGRAELKHGKDAGFVQTLNDFGKNVREEIEQIDEISYDKLQDYTAAAKQDRAHNDAVIMGRYPGSDKKAYADNDKRKKGLDLARKKIHNKLMNKEEVELEEDSKDTKNAYIASLGAKKLGTNPTSNTSANKTPRLNTKAIRAGRALLKAGMDEEVEQIDEISKGLATAYSAKAKRTLRPLQNKLDMGLPNPKAMKMTNKRSSGILKAADKLSGSAKINATEDLDEAQVKKPTAYEKDVALVDGKPNTSAKMGVNKLAYALDKSDNKKVTLPKMPWDK